MFQGRCQCGAVQYEVKGQPRLMLYCYCQQCRRANGSSLATSIIVRTDDFSTTRGEATIRAYESSPGNYRHFCSACGSPIYGEMAASPELRSIRAGTVEGDPGVCPSAHVHVASKAPWVEIHDDLPQYEEGLER